MRVKVLPGASRDEALEVSNGRLRVRVAAAPEDGKANVALCVFFAKMLGCSKSAVVVRAGEKSRLKTLRLPLTALDALLRITRKDKAPLRNATSVAASKRTSQISG